ncbi:glycyl-radical enzyme activating protein [Parabacteroides acidifaciens]|uniref:Glycyl-radical enzyme activating protein n=1 Tax=Parabacteroides acidifaciens TaxID=2290935 RepID=A0A3D8HGT2_9BACT|nr:glycyl-radical enzyme activating protein [Parabacteroides acidifaciens]MBC8601473.1 glycyl-radical enzyme activating protein [Parabacteroides acidifaciens]RDU49797.1 glycyl-radical enzyme activating protein [Parabacteroides acidifaciens]
MLVFDIKRYAINDGPGIRITIFMKGCPLSCVWCHNPEGLSSRKEKLYTKKKCIGCQTCVKACPEQALTLTPDGIVTDRTRCTLCGTCAEVCPALAMEISGTEYSTDALMKEIEKETVFMDRSEGGVTFCGGEPLLHPEPLLELLRRCGEQGIHRAVDTTLFARPEIVRKVMDNCELFLVDLKQMDSAKHKHFCGVPNEPILANLRMIAEAGHDFYLRIPLIEGVNADEENITRSAEFLASLPWKYRTVNLLLYHDIGKGKHEKLGTIYNPGHCAFATPSDETVERCRGIFANYGIETAIGG